jgi:hypothetical protein
MMQRREVLLHFNRYLHEEDIVLAALASTTRDCYQVRHRCRIHFVLDLYEIFGT